ncbi:MAG: hypothetical protein WBA07_01590 [Rivularia sp. (in: cyanobacteria)]
MSKSDTLLLYLWIFTLAIASYLFTQNHQIEKQLNDCNSRYEGFKDGVMYGK